MPSKGKRVASRQQNLRRRRHNSNRSNTAGSVVPTAVTEAATGSSEATPASSSVATAAPAATATQAIGRPQAQPRGRRFDRPAAYNHVGSELKRIGIFSSVLVVVLIAVSFVI